MAKTKTRRRRTTTTLPSKATNTTLFSGYLLSSDPKGVFIGTKRKGVTLLESKRKEVKRKEVTLQQGSKSKWQRQVNEKKKEK